MKRVVVLTGFNGENELEKNILSVKNQTNVIVVDHLIGRGMTLDECQTWIFDQCNLYRNTCDYFLKLDADMVLHSTDSLSTMISYVNSSERITFLVNDYISNSKIIGVHLIKSSVFPTSREIHPYRHDFWLESIEGTLVKKVFVDHAQDASIYQISHFVSQRLKKGLRDGYRSDYWLIILRFCFVSLLKWDLLRLKIFMQEWANNSVMLGTNRSLFVFRVLTWNLCKYVYRKI